MMTDKNGVEMKTGDIVEVKNAYFKNDNGVYFIAHSPNDASWRGSDYSLTKMKKNGELSTAKYNIAFWPLSALTSNRQKNIDCRVWNEQRATIEVIYNIDNAQVVEHFKQKAEVLEKQITRQGWDFGEESEIVIKSTEIKNHYLSVAERLSKTEAPDQVQEPEKSEPITEEPTAPLMQNVVRKYYEINEKMAYAANMVNSFREYKSGSATETYKYYCDKAYNILDQIAEKKPEQAESAARKADYYCRKLAEYYNDYYRNEAACPSIMISGGSNFPVRKKEKQNSRRDTLMNTWSYLESYLQKINNILTGHNPIKSGEPTAIEQLKKKIADLEHKKETAQNANKYYRKNGTLKGFTDFTESEIEKKMDFLNRINYTGTSPFDTTNTNAEIKRLKTRLENLEKTKSAGTTTESATTNDGIELFKVIENTEIMRLQLLFEDKPEETTREILKKNGFRWSPSNKAWQRLLNDNAKYSLKQIKKELTA